MGRRVAIGVLGAGRIGRLHAELLAHTLAGVARVQAVADPRPSAAAAAAETTGARAEADWRAVVADPAVDAVLVCSPTDTHAEIVEAAAAAGKHVFCEKPIALDLERTTRAVRAMERAGVKLQVGFNRRFDPGFARLAQGVRAGEIGTPEIVRITSRDPEPPPADYVAGSGGLFLDMSIHDFDMARFLAGDEVVEVQAYGAVLVDPALGRAGDIDTAVVALRFAGGALGAIDNSRRATYGYDQRAEVLGSRGALVAENRAPHAVARWDASGRTLARPHDFFLDRYREAYAAELGAFVDAVRDDLPPPVGGEDGIAALRIALAAQRSLRDNRPVRIERSRA